MVFILCENINDCFLKENDKTLTSQRHLSHLSFCRKGFFDKLYFHIFFSGCVYDGWKIILFIYTLWEKKTTQFEQNTRKYSMFVFQIDCYDYFFFSLFSLYACLFCCTKQTDTDLINDSILPMCAFHTFAFLKYIKHIFSILSLCFVSNVLRWLNRVELACGWLSVLNHIFGRWHHKFKLTI